MKPFTNHFHSLTKTEISRTRRFNGSNVKGILVCGFLVAALVFVIGVTASADANPTQNSGRVLAFWERSQKNLIRMREELSTTLYAEPKDIIRSNRTLAAKALALNSIDQNAAFRALLADEQILTLQQELELLPTLKAQVEKLPEKLRLEILAAIAKEEEHAALVIGMGRERVFLSKPAQSALANSGLKRPQSSAGWAALGLGVAASVLALSYTKHRQEAQSTEIEVQKTALRIGQR